MEAYFLFRRGGDATVPEAAVCQEQLEDIGSPSDSESPSTSMDSADSSLELDDDATSFYSGSDSPHSHSFEMASLMTQLPFKRGLSRFFDGKSQSFASLQAVGSLEDLAKPPRKRLKPSRSCGGGLDGHRGRLLSPRRHCAKAAAGAKKAAARSSALVVLGAATMRPQLAVPARPEGAAGKVLVVS